VPRLPPPARLLHLPLALNTRPRRESVKDAEHCQWKPCCA
jgi:hypothetical protein